MAETCSQYPYLTLSALPTGYTCRQFWLPDDVEWKAAIYGVLSILASEDYVQQSEGGIEVWQQANEILSIITNDLICEEGGGGGFMALAQLGYLLASGTSAGTNQVGAWYQYPLNTIVRDDHSLLNLVTNRFQVQAGLFNFNIDVALRAVGDCRISLYNVTQAQYVSIGLSSQGDRPRCTGHDISNGSDWYEVRYWAQTTNVGDGLGSAVGSGNPELFASVDIGYQEIV